VPEVESVDESRLPVVVKVKVNEAIVGVRESVSEEVLVTGVLLSV
jgi:hypothetical protein